MNKLLSECTVDSAEALRDILSRARIDVPERGAGRTSDHTEPWIFAHLLSTLNAADELSFPLRWCKRERPDYLVCCASHEQGVEISELVSPALAQATAVRNEEFPDKSIDPSLFRPGTAPTSREAVRALLRGGRSGYGWNGNSVEREWAEAVVKRTSEKSASLREPGYSLYSGNWLLLYDNLPGPALNLEEAVALVQAELRSCLILQPGFASVSVLSHDQLVVFSSAPVRVLSVASPWAAAQQAAEADGRGLQPRE